MKVAILVNSDYMDIFDKDIMRAVVVEVDNNDSVDVIDEEFFTRRGLNHFTLWLLSNRIKEIYVQGIDERGKSYFENLDVAVKTYHDLENKPFFKFLS